ncbi:hypothetical protein SAMN04488061_2851 [Filomicrobium insigne]|uniref:Uncharacterized protein n=1 Tax=Filomicrobium insigne TaxID=418854 RepID=A0A1H0SDF2_9HYPH|nr:hypothetical protein [Filomicrobium insigne]SDP39832.1 hypothetical protein SAMN04488061_2851 [Filomicrobium insigne]
MSLPTGTAEQEIRTAAEQLARRYWPSARIVHELNVENGISRADIAVITADRLILMELKSERDTLDRLPNQIEQFTKVAHHVIVVAHRKWCDSAGWQTNNEGQPFLPQAPIFRPSAGATVWEYSEGKCKGNAPHAGCSWPWTARMLNLLWNSELQRVCYVLRVATTKRPTRGAMIDDLMRLCRAPELEQAVLAQLRTRQFATDDAIQKRKDDAAEATTCPGAKRPGASAAPAQAHEATAEETAP